ncbi:MAG: cyclic nucleotide-binding domain-containing protein [Deltaproteobacteria bacterium]|nr:cyclic nucleotide-binding domain-containing protein [Deltaproteobacteria bacterium]
MTIETTQVPDTMTSEDFFSGSLLFQALDDQGLEELKASAQLVSAEAGDMIITEGARDEFVYLVRSGKLSAWTSRTGRDVKLGDLEPGSIFGEIAELGQIARTATVKAETECNLTRFPGERFMEILGRYPKARESLTNIVLKRAEDNLDKTL